jgi:hypothetical protein
MVSAVWNYFEKTSSEKNPDTGKWDHNAKCKSCGEDMKCSQGSTSSLFGHLK